LANELPLIKNNMENFITVAVFSYPHEITILKHRLNMENISYYFENEAMVSIMPFYSLAVGGIKLKIHPNDNAAVISIINDLNFGDQLRIV